MSVPREEAVAQWKRELSAARNRRSFCVDCITSGYGRSGTDYAGAKRDADADIKRLTALIYGGPPTSDKEML